MKLIQAGTNSIGVGTSNYWAPEQSFVGNGKYDSKVDVYPIGVMMFEFLIGQDPITAQCYET